MDNEQLQKRVDWLDGERRKDKLEIASLEKRIDDLETSLDLSAKQAKEISSDLAQARATLSKLDQLETNLSQFRVEVNRNLEDFDKVRKSREDEIEDLRRVQFDGVHKQITDLRKELDQISAINTQMTTVKDEDVRLNRKLDELKVSVLEVERNNEEGGRSMRLMEEGRRRDEKRLSDLQGEVLALRKRSDELRGKLDLSSDTLRRMDNRLSEFSTVEVERRESYNAFIEKQTLAQVDRDRKWSEWQTRFELIENQAVEFEERVHDLHTAQRDIRQTQENVESVADRVERRINEITEMQRLDEDRFRQEWTTFKADDQKRWTNYTLTQEEQTREATRARTRSDERMMGIEERLQDVEDLLNQLNLQNESQLQQLLAMLRDWVAETEQTFGNNSR